MINRAWDALSPDPFLVPYKFDYLWLTKVYESEIPTDGRGTLIWDALGPKTIELVHENESVYEVHGDLDICFDADIIDEYLEGRKDPNKAAEKIEINLVQEYKNMIKTIYS